METCLFVVALMCSAQLTAIAGPTTEASPTGGARASNRLDPASTLLPGGLGLGASLDGVQKALGTPSQEQSGVSDEKTGEMKILRYFGVVFTCVRQKPGADYHVQAIRITSSQYGLAGGLKVGISRDEVARLVGRPKLTGVDGGSGNELLHFDVGRDAFLTLEVENDKVVQIELEMH